MCSSWWVTVEINSVVNMEKRRKQSLSVCQTVKYRYEWWWLWVTWEALRVGSVSLIMALNEAHNQWEWFEDVKCTPYCTTYHSAIQSVSQSFVLLCVTWKWSQVKRRAESKTRLKLGYHLWVVLKWLKKWNEMKWKRMKRSHDQSLSCWWCAAVAVLLFSWPNRASWAREVIRSSSAPPCLLDFFFLFFCGIQVHTLIRQSVLNSPQ